MQVIIKTRDKNVQIAEIPGTYLPDLATHLVFEGRVFRPSLHDREFKPVWIEVDVMKIEELITPETRPEPTYYI